MTIYSEVVTSPVFYPKDFGPREEREIQVLPLTKRIQRLSSLLPNLSTINPVYWCCLGLSHRQCAPASDVLQYDMKPGWSQRRCTSSPYHSWQSREARWFSHPLAQLQYKHFTEKGKFQSTHRKCSNHWPVHQRTGNSCCWFFQGHLCVLLPWKLLQMKTEFCFQGRNISFDPPKSLRKIFPFSF